MSLCRCGCGERIPDGQWYVHGHNWRGKDRPELRKKNPKKRSWHERAVRKLEKAGKTECEWEHIGHCKGVLDVAHVNGDWRDERPANLKRLCRSHHFLLDHGKIDPKNPKMPDFYTGKDGKRRYRKK
jgi:hypothetical protein